MNAASSPTFRGKRIGVFGKGGSGKSTLTALLARHLAAEGVPVCVLDADSTNRGLPGAVGLQAPSRSLLDYYGGMVFSGGEVTCPVDDPRPLPHRRLDLTQLPREYLAQEDGLTLLTAGKIGDLGPGAGCDGPVSKIARDVVLEHPEGSPLTLIDFKAGLEDSARGALTRLDWLLLVVDPTTASLEMARSMQELVGKIRRGDPPATAHLQDPDMAALAIRFYQEAALQGLSVVLNRAADTAAENYLRDTLNQIDLQPLAVIPEDRALTRAWLEGTPLPREKTQPALEAAADQLEAILHDSP